MSHHIPDATKMIGETPRTDAAWKPDGGDGYPTVDVDLARQLERELNAANERIKLLEAVTNDPHALWANWLRGSVALPVGIGDVRQYQDRIKRLEEELERTKQDRNAIAKTTREPLLLKLDHAAERIKRLEEEGGAVEKKLGCGCGCYGLCKACQSASENWFKAKEAKP